MTPEELLAQLRARGLVVLGVSRHHEAPDLLIVYLHANAGQWVDGLARRLIGRVPGVVAVTDRLETPAILYARVEASLPS